MWLKPGESRHPLAETYGHCFLFQSNICLIYCAHSIISLIIQTLDWNRFFFSHIPWYMNNSYCHQFVIWVEMNSTDNFCLVTEKITCLWSSFCTWWKISLPVIVVCPALFSFVIFFSLCFNLFLICHSLMVFCFYLFFSVIISV